MKEKTNPILAGCAALVLVLLCIAASSTYNAGDYPAATNLANSDTVLGQTNFASTPTMRNVPISLLKSTIGGPVTNFSLTIGANGTNHANALSVNSTNYANTLAANSTNHANALSANATNEAARVKGEIISSNYLTQASGLNASNLSGTLPALDGTQLTGISTTANLNSASNTLQAQINLGVTNTASSATLGGVTLSGGRPSGTYPFPTNEYVIALGDSRTAGWTSSGWPYWFTNSISNPALLAGVVNLGVGSKTISNMWYDYDSTVAPYAPTNTGTNATLVVWGSINDNNTGVQIATCLNALSNILLTAKAQGFAVLACTEPDAPTLQTAAKQLYRYQVNMFVVTNSYCDYIAELDRLFPLFTTDTNSWLNDGSSHFTPNSERLVAQEIYRVLSTPRKASVGRWPLQYNLSVANNLTVGGVIGANGSGISNVWNGAVSGTFSKGAVKFEAWGAGTSYNVYGCSAGSAITSNSITAVSASATLPFRTRFAGTNVAGNWTLLRGSFSEYVSPSADFKASWVFSIPSTQTSNCIWVAMTGLPHVVNSDTKINTVGFRYSHRAGDTEWKAMSSNGTDQYTNSTGVALSTGTTIVAAVSKTSAGIVYYLNGAPVATNSTGAQWPATGMSITCANETRTDNSPIFDFVYMSFEQPIP